MTDTKTRPHEFLDETNAPILCALLKTHPGLADEVDQLALVANHAALASCVSVARELGDHLLANAIAAAASGVADEANALHAKITGSIN